jgi:histone-lysine N-methyltransferase SETMAR
MSEDADEAILSALGDTPFASICQLARLTHLSAATVYRRVGQSLGFTARHLRWVPHLLSDVQKLEPVQAAQLLLRKVGAQQQRAWHGIVTVDESWFFLTTYHDFIWLPETENVRERERPMIESTKLMLRIVRNPQGFHVANVLPKGYKFNAGYHITELLSALFDWRRTQQRSTDGKLLVHAANARPHTAQASKGILEAHGMEKAPHPPYSPDIAPSDFYLFDHVTNRLAGASFADADELFEAVMTVSGEIAKVTLEAVCLEWMD